MPSNRKKSLNIGMILDGSYPRDIRVRKEAESLAKFHSVSILCCKNEGDKEYEEINGVKIVRAISYKNNFERGLIDVFLSIRFIHPYFYKKLKRFIDDFSLDVIHVHDLPLAKSAYLAAQKKEIISILDLHENYAAALSTWFSWRKNPIIRLKNKIFFGYNRWSKYESSCLPHFDRIITVVEEMKQRILNENSIEGHKIVVIPNSEKKVFFKNFEFGRNNYFKNDKDRFIVSYVGGFGPHRGLHIAIEGMKYVTKQISHVKLVLVGPANKDVHEHLNNLVKKYGLEHHVEIKGREPFEKVVEIMQGSNINIVPHISNEHTESAVPHKLYQILLSGKPLLVSDCAPMKRMVSENEMGYVFESGNPMSFAEKVIEIYEDPKKAEQRAQKGFQETYEGKLNWEHTEGDLLHLYDNLKN
jgi:glycosyltransferase involved in cell wall biosynthesis